MEVELSSGGLQLLHDSTVGTYRLRIEIIGKSRYVDQQNFVLYLAPSKDPVRDTLVFRGRYSAGRPSAHLPGWIEGDFLDPGYVADGQGGVDYRLESAVAEQLGRALRPGDRFWIAYEAFDHDDPLQRETRAALEARVPLLTTPIGHLLFQAGCWAGLRDWYIAEGGREGPRKLRGNKALHRAHMRQSAVRLLRELTGFLAWPSDDEVVRRARLRAQAIMPRLQSVLEDPSEEGGGTHADRDDNRTSCKNHVEYH